MEKGIREKVKDFYEGKLAQYGMTAKGVDWKDEQAQVLRFEQLLKVVNPDKPFSVNDLGCGYGALLPYILEKGYRVTEYNGYDISAKMLEASHKILKECEVETALVLADTVVFPADYSFCSGTLNVRLDTSEMMWLKFILDTLDSMHGCSVKGFSFNCMTNKGLDFRDNSLYYADPDFFLDYCEKRFRGKVELLENYGLYEWTILVRKV